MGTNLLARVNSREPETQLSQQPTVYSRCITAHTPAKHAQAIYHGRVRVSAHNTVWIIVAVLIHHHSCQVLQIHLVDDPRAWWNNPHVFKSLRAPLKRRNWSKKFSVHMSTGRTSVHCTFLDANRINSFSTFKNSNLSLFLSNSRS